MGSALAYRDMEAAIDAHGLKPQIARRFALADAKEAYRYAASGEGLGKVVIDVAPR